MAQAMRADGATWEPIYANDAEDALLDASIHTTGDVYLPTIETSILTRRTPARWRSSRSKLNWIKLDQALKERWLQVLEKNLLLR